MEDIDNWLLSSWTSLFKGKQPWRFGLFCCVLVKRWINISFNKWWHKTHLLCFVFKVFNEPSLQNLTKKNKLGGRELLIGSDLSKYLSKVAFPRELFEPHKKNRECKKKKKSSFVTVEQKSVLKMKLIILSCHAHKVRMMRSPDSRETRVLEKPTNSKPHPLCFHSLYTVVMKYRI